MFIDNYALDGAMDTVEIDADYKTLSVEREGEDLQLRGQKSHNESSVRVIGYFGGQEYQHMVVKAGDGETVLIRNDTEVQQLKLAIDKTGMKKGQRVDLLRRVAR